MTLTPTLELQVRPEGVVQARMIFDSLLGETRAFRGNLGLVFDTLESPEHPAVYESSASVPEPAPSSLQCRQAALVHPKMSSAR